MEVPQESENSLAYRLQLCFDQFCGWFCFSCKKTQHFDQQANDNNEMLIELTNTTGTDLQHLNDDCLLEIFSVQSLSLMDLCSLAETCKRFQQISQRVFPKDLLFDIRFDENFDVHSTKYQYNENRPSKDVERILKNFGSSLSEVSILRMFMTTNEESSRFVLNQVADYCVDSLDSLRIERVKIPAILTVKLKPIFERLQSLDLYKVDIENDETLFADLQIH